MNENEIREMRDKITKMKQQINDLIGEVKIEVCDKICRYTNDPTKSLLQEELDVYCESCPLNKL